MKAKYEAGDIFLVPLLGSESFGIGQIVEITKEALNSVLCSFYDLEFACAEDFDLAQVSDDRLIAIQFTSPDLLQLGRWRVVGHSNAISPQDYIDLKSLKENGYIGAEIEGSAIIEKFLSAFLGYWPWNCYYKADYFDGMLLFLDRKPANLIYKKN